MDMTILLTAVGTVIAVIGSNIALISWLRADMKAFENKITGWKEEINKEMKDFQQAMMMESKDFHGRLCSIESRYYQKDIEKRDQET